MPKFMLACLFMGIILKNIIIFNIKVINPHSCCGHTDMLASLLAWSDWQHCVYLSL